MESNDVSQERSSVPVPPSEPNPTVATAQLEEKKDMMEQSELHHDVALSVTGTSIDENVQYINDMNSNENVVFQQTVISNSNRSMCLCTLWERKELYTLILAPIMLFLLLLLMLAVNNALIVVYLLSIFIFLMVLMVGYFYGYIENGSILDLFTLSMLFGGCLGFLGWVFIWLLAITNFILLGPFIFTHSGYVITSSVNTVILSVISCIMYGAIFPFVLIWTKSDKRLIEDCFKCCKHCKLNGFYTLKEYEQLQHILNLPQKQMDEFMASNEAEIKAKLEVAMKRLQIECVASIVGFVGSIYIFTFIFKFNHLNMKDATLIFIMGYLIKDLIFAIFFGIIASYIIGRRRLYQIKMNNKFVHYGFIMILGVLQQCIGTVLSGLYPQSTVRMIIIYISMGVNVVICIVAFIETHHQKKLFRVQLDTLFVYSAVNNQLSLSGIAEQ